MWRSQRSECSSSNRVRDDVSDGFERNFHPRTWSGLAYGSHPTYKQSFCSYIQEEKHRTVGGHGSSNFDPTNALVVLAKS